MNKSQEADSTSQESLNENDLGWSKERDGRAQKIWDTLNKAKRENLSFRKETIEEYLSLIQETEDAVRSNPKRGSGLVASDSEFLIQLQGDFAKTIRQMVQREEITFPTKGE